MTDLAALPRPDWLDDVSNPDGIDPHWPPQNEAGVYFERRFECSCDHEWHDVWDCDCDGECPNCGATCTSVDATEIDALTGQPV